MVAAFVSTLALGGPDAVAQDVAPTDPHDMTEMATAPEGGDRMPASHLQAMIDAVPPGGALSVPQAVYVGAILLDEPIELTGIGRPVIDGAGHGSVVTISASEVSFRGFTVRGSGDGPIDSPSGVLLEDADRVRVEDVVIEDSYIGVTVRSSVDVVIGHVHITGRPEAAIQGELHAVADEGGMAGGATHAGAAEAGSRGDGIWLWNATSATLRDITIAEVRDGVYVSYGTGSVLDGVTIERSRYAIHDMYGADLVIRDSTLRDNLSGCVLMYGGPVLIEGNTIVDNGSPSTGFGVLVKDAGDVTVTGNVIAGNRVGVHVDDAGRTGGRPAWIGANTLAMNQVGVTLYPSTDATFVRNAFVENTTQVSLGGQGDTQAVWTVDGVGNHWSDYEGYDADGDGIGDLPYEDGGRADRVLAGNPVLIALASGPGLRLLSFVDDRWSASEPIVTDLAPLVERRGPRAALDGPGSMRPLAVAGAVMVVLASTSLVRARRPRGARGPRRA
jgi:nitrous oxidase accessory protein